MVLLVLRRGVAFHGSRGFGYGRSGAHPSPIGIKPTSPLGPLPARRWSLASREAPENLSCPPSPIRLHRTMWLPRRDMTGGPTRRRSPARARRARRRAAATTGDVTARPFRFRAAAARRRCRAPSNEIRRAKRRPRPAPRDAPGGSGKPGRREAGVGPCPGLPQAYPRPTPNGPRTGPEIAPPAPAGGSPRTRRAVAPAQAPARTKGAIRWVFAPRAGSPARPAAARAPALRRATPGAMSWPGNSRRAGMPRGPIAPHRWRRGAGNDEVFTDEA